MKLSTRGRYAARALLDLALHQNNGPTSLKEIAARQDVSPKYLDQILSQLRNAGIVRAMRGSKGGFSLAVESDNLTLLKVITVMEGRTAIVDCVGEGAICERAEECVTRDVWADVGTAIDQVLGAITIGDLVERTKNRSNPPCPR